MSKILFENFHVLVLESGDLPRAEIIELEQILQRHQVPYEIKDIGVSIDKNEFVEKGFTHIISNSVLFDFYSIAQEKLIPVASTKLIYATVEKGKQQPIRPYSPDPKHVLKDVHICCGSLPVADKEAIFGGVWALGGTFSEMLNKYVTHVISVNPDEDVVIAVESLKQFQIKAVVPLWIDHCLKLRKRLDETPYLLSNEHAGDPTEKILELDVVRKNKSMGSIVQADFLQGKEFYLGDDLQLTESSTDLISSLVKNSGGTVVLKLDDAKFYVGQFRDGDEYTTASRQKLYVGNLNWIYWMVEHQKWVSPYRKLLHYPYVRGGMPAMQDFTIAASNYSGDARFYIKKLIEAVGAKFTANLTPNNTHLITSQGAGKKFQAAHNWKLNIVNHLWLEECYANWKLEPVTHPRYSVNLGGKVKLEDIVGETPLDVEVLKQFYEDGYSPITTHMVEDSEDEPEIALRNKSDTAVLPVLETLDESVSKKKKVTEKIVEKERNNVDESTPIQTPLKKNQRNTPTGLKGLVDALSTDVRSSSRKAKDKAALKLHADIEDMNLFQKQSKGLNILLPEEIEERKRKREEDAQKHAHKKEKSVSEETPVKRSKKEPTPQLTTRYDIVAIATGWEVEFSRPDTQLLHSLGISIHKEFKKGINAIIAPKLMRTEKFLVGLSYGLKYIISADFLKQVIKLSKSGVEESALPDPLEFSLDVTNAQSVKELTLCPLSEITRRCQDLSSENKGLFSEVSFNITAKLPGGATTVQKILKAHHCKDVKVIKTIKEMKSMKVFKSKSSGETIFISNEKGMNDRFKALCKEEGARGKIVEWDWVIASLFKMDMEGSAHVTYES